MSPRRAAGGQKTAFQHFHFVYSVRFIQKYLLLTLVPLAQALLNRQLAAFWQALRQSAGLLGVLALLALARGRAAGWRLEASGCLRLRTGLALRRQLALPAGTLAALRLERPPGLRLLGASALTLYPARTARLRPVTLYLSRREAAALAGRLMPLPAGAARLRPTRAERLCLALLNANALSSALVLAAAWRQVRALGGWAEQAARAGLDHALALAADWLPVRAGWLPAALAALLAFSLLRSGCDTAFWRLYVSGPVLAMRGGLLCPTETRIRTAAVTACDIRATPTARLLGRWPVYLAAGSYRGALPVLLRPGRPDQAGRLAALLPGAVLPDAAPGSARGRSLAAFVLWPGVLAGGTLLALAAATKAAPALVPALAPAAGAALTLLAVAWDGRRRERALRAGGRLTVCTVRRFTLHCWCFFAAPASAHFRQTPPEAARGRGRLTLAFPAGLRVRVRSVTRQAARRALS